MRIFDISTIQIALAVLIIVLCAVFILIDLYLALGWISPDLGIRIDLRIRKALNKPPVIILDPWYIRQRNSKWFLWTYVLSHVVVLAIAFIIVSIG
jgi:hypothetical protein